MMAVWVVPSGRVARKGKTTCAPTVYTAGTGVSFAKVGTPSVSTRIGLFAGALRSLTLVEPVGLGIVPFTGRLVYVTLALLEMLLPARAVSSTLAVMVTVIVLPGSRQVAVT